MWHAASRDPSLLLFPPSAPSFKQVFHRWGNRVLPKGRDCVCITQRVLGRAQMRASASTACGQQLLPQLSNSPFLFPSLCSPPFLFFPLLSNCPLPSLTLPLPPLPSFPSLSLASS